MRRTELFNILTLVFSRVPANGYSNVFEGYYSGVSSPNGDPFGCTSVLIPIGDADKETSELCKKATGVFSRKYLNDDLAIREKFYSENKGNRRITTAADKASANALAELLKAIADDRLELTLNAVHDLLYPMEKNS